MSAATKTEKSLEQKIADAKEEAKRSLVILNATCVSFLSVLTFMAVSSNGIGDVERLIVAALMLFVAVAIGHFAGELYDSHNEYLELLDEK